MRIRRPRATAGVVLAGALALLASLAFIAPHVAAQDSTAPAGASKGAPRSDPGKDLVAALKNTPGCLGVEQAFTQTRKNAIFAWFKDKGACLDWYYSDYHQNAMLGLQAASPPAASVPAKSDAKAHEAESGEARTEPLQWVPDDCGPILCIATITPSAPGAKSVVNGFPQLIAQISIELYTPLPGGIAVNGRFAPSAVKVPHLLDQTIPASDSPKKQ